MWNEQQVLEFSHSVVYWNESYGGVRSPGIQVPSCFWRVVSRGTQVKPSCHELSCEKNEEDEKSSHKVVVIFGASCINLSEPELVFLLSGTYMVERRKWIQPRKCSLWNKIVFHAWKERSDDTGVLSSSRVFCESACLLWDVSWQSSRPTILNQYMVHG